MRLSLSNQAGFSLDCEGAEIRGAFRQGLQKTCRIGDYAKQQSKSLAALLNHQITGNGIDTMKQIRDELLESIIDQ